MTRMNQATQMALTLNANLHFAWLEMGAVNELTSLHEEVTTAQHQLREIKTLSFQSIALNREIVKKLRLLVQVQESLVHSASLREQQGITC
jgi:hypothetical protein